MSQTGPERSGAPGRPARQHNWRIGPLLLGCALIAFAGCGDRIDVRPASADPLTGERRSLVAMARLEPASRVVNVGSAANDVVKEVMVQAGNEVVAGQVLVLLDSYAVRAAELEAARLMLERAALQPLEVAAQRARVRAIEAELEYAKDEVGNQKGLSEKGFSAGKEFRDAQLAVRRSTEQLNEANAVLQRLEANANLEEREGRNQIFQAEARLEQTMIRSPLDGQVLRVMVHEGERINSRAVVSLGATQTMHAVAEVHANDIRNVQVGQLARFTSPAVAAPLEGSVEAIGSMVLNNYISGEDPTAPLGLRVVEVRVRLDDNELARSMTNLEGQLRIYLDDFTAQR